MRCWRFGAATRREERGYPLWICERRATSAQRSKVREMGSAMMNDIRFAFRMLVKAPGFSIVSFLAIALGLGVNTSIFGIINTLLMRPLPVGNSQELVQIYTKDPHLDGRAPTSYLNFVDYAKE